MRPCKPRFKASLQQAYLDKTEEDYNKENQEVIQRCVADEKNEKTIIAWGSCGEGNKRIQAYQKSLLEKLSGYEDKLFVIQDGRGKSGLHPLTPSIRNRWELIPFQVPKTQNQPMEQTTPPEVAAIEEKLQETEVSAKEAEEKQQPEETAETDLIPKLRFRSVFVPELVRNDHSCYSQFINNF